MGIWLIKHATVIFGGVANKSGLLQHNINGEKYFSTLFVDTKKVILGFFIVHSRQGKKLKKTGNLWNQVLHWNEFK